jgi:hypothetical protein
VRPHKDAYYTHVMKMLSLSQEDPSLEEGSGQPSNCEPRPRPKYAEALIILVYFIFDT